MTVAPTEAAAPEAPAERWICPFCPLLCDHLGVLPPDPTSPDAPLARLRGAECGRATRRLDRLRPEPAGASAAVDGQPCALDAALQAAAAILQASRQPLFGGLGTDVAGARALYRLANATGAICDSAQGPALTQLQAALQDRGGYTTTLAELRNRADLVLCLGGVFAASAPLFVERCLLPPRSAAAAATARPRQVVVLGGGTADSAADAEAEGAALARLGAAPTVALQTLPLHGDLHDTVALLSALVAARRPGAAPPALVALASALRSASYGVIVGAPGSLPAQGALVIEMVHRIIDELNRHTRAAALWLGGGEGAATVNQVFTWLSGLPLRSRAGPAGLEHQPRCFDATRLLADRAVDALLWVSSFDADALPPITACPAIVFGPPALGAALHERRRDGGAGFGPTVFIPVATPGIDVAGDLFRTDGTVLLPLRPLPWCGSSGLAPLAELLGRVEAAMPPAADR